MEERPNTKVAFNLHAWGPLYIIPYSYYKDAKNKEMKQGTTIYNIYKEYENEGKFPRSWDFEYGNAYKAIKYVANGDAGDWMLHERGIIAFSVEVGSDCKHKDCA